MFYKICGVKMAKRKTESEKVVDKYVKDILWGKKIACKMLILACERYKKDMVSEKFDFKPEQAEKVVQIIEKTFIHTKGNLVGKPFLLESWQKFIIFNLCGFYYKGINERRFKEAFIYIPRKNGKTNFAGALGWALSLIYAQETSTLCIVSTKLHRALESWECIRGTIKRLGETEAFKILNNNAEHSISKEFTTECGEILGSIKIEALANNSDKADGINANLFILDEVHAYKSANDYHVYKQAMKAYINKLLIAITTAGKNMNSFCYNLLTLCVKILEGSIEADEHFIFITEADNKDDYTNPVEHEKANPNYGITIRPRDILNESLQAQNEPSSRNEFLNKSLNIYTNTASSYFDVEQVKESNDAHNYTIGELTKLPIKWYGGADLSISHDLTGVCLVGEYNETLIVVPHSFMPITVAQKKAMEDNIPFFGWVDDKALTMCNGDIINFHDVVKWFIKMRDLGFKIPQVGFDKYHSREFVKLMEKHKFKIMSIDQNYWKKSEAFRFIERKIMDKHLYYLNNPAFLYCISNVKGIEDDEERVRFSKVQKNYRIDVFDATATAVKCKLINEDRKSQISNYF